MRHGKSGKQFGRNTTLRAATVRDLAKAILIQERITTIGSRAKEARKLVDRLITMGKEGTLAAKRRAFAVLCDHKLVSNLFNEIAGRFKNRAGGYTRIIPLGVNRKGDNASLVLFELVEKSKKQPPKVSAAQKVLAKDKKEVPVVEDAIVKPETKEAHEAEAKKREVPRDKKEERKILKIKDKVSKSASGGISKMFRLKKPE
ncbi:MAG: 50S ribosomal protein L17 [Candidatus Omnitrophica bacterium]|nr:50S ribosomal protein L17 [Candidatus Omnitrophota bacterium]